MNRLKSIGLYTYFGQAELKYLSARFVERLSDDMLMQRILNHFGSGVNF